MLPCYLNHTKQVINNICEDVCLDFGESRLGGGQDMYAILEAGGKQFKVQEGDWLKVEKMPFESGEMVEFNNVLAISNDNNELTVGKPYVEGAKVTAKVIEQGKDKKVIVFKFRAKKDYRKKKGHRQPYTKVVIEKIEA